MLKTGLSRYLPTILFICFIISSQAEASTLTLYGIGPSSLLRIDRETGVVQTVGDVGVNVLSGLAIDASGLMITTHNDPALSGPQLVSINPKTGAGTLIGSVNPDLGSISGLAFGRSGDLFGVTFFGDLVWVDPASGNVVNVGSNGLAPTAFIGDISFSQSGSLFGVTFDPGDPTQGIPGSPPKLVTIDTATGLATPVGDLVPEINMAGIAFDQGDSLNGVTSAVEQDLVEINISTAGVTPLVSLEMPSPSVGTIAFGHITPIDIDIKPFSKRNVINPHSKGSIWVAILSETDPDSPFDPSSQVDISTVEFGPDGAEVIRYKVKDLNKDGLGDLLLRFKIPDTGIACGDTEATLTGETFDGVSFTGTDAIETVGCKPKICYKKIHHHEKHLGKHHDDDCDDDGKYDGKHKEKEHHYDDHDDDHKKR